VVGSLKERQDERRSQCARGRLLLGGVLGQHPPEIAYWERGEWWLAGDDARPWQPDAVNVLSDKLVFRPRLTPAAGRDVWHP
jgi:hypothetical protein